MATRPMDERRAVELRAAPLTYDEVGLTRHAAPIAGYRSFRRSVDIDVDFGSACRDLLAWTVQLRAGVRVAASGVAAADAVVDLRLGVGPFALTAPCRVVYVIDEPDRCGFAYGTLPGHPESGEEAFLLARVDATVTLTIVAFSRPASALTRLAGPVARRVQDIITARYLRSFD